MVLQKLLKRKLEIFFLLCFFIFSWWLMYKSFGYNANTHSFRIARNEVGDFGLHLSLIRSFSWGNNFPPQSPFFPGKPLPYHYYFDLAVGLLERIGIRIDYAFNGLSIIFFTALLYFIYLIPQRLFFKSKMLGMISVLLFMLHSSTTFLDFLKTYGFSFYNFWHLPDYIHKGPFDGSLVSIFFTLNVYLNQRHLVVALAISLGIVYFFLPYFLTNKKPSKKTLLICSGLLGLVSGIHTLIFLTTGFVLLLMCFLYKKLNYAFLLFLPAFLIFSFRVKDILSQDLKHPYFNPGFLSQTPLSAVSFINFWFVNTGLAFFLIPLGVYFSGKKQKLFFISLLPLFIIGNIFQLSFRIEHNHSVFNFFFIFCNFYIAFFLIRYFSKGVFKKAILCLFIVILTASGFVDLMVVKNDFQLPFSDAPKNKFMLWIKDNTNPNSIFLAYPYILDPVTISGRRNYLGNDYYLSVMGYDFAARKIKTSNFFQVDSLSILKQAKNVGIDYIAVPNKKISDFIYKVNRGFLDNNLSKVYNDKSVSVYKL